ncbi:MAG: ABC transporter permease subunit [Thermotogota bacterium]
MNKLFHFLVWLFIATMNGFIVWAAATLFMLGNNGFAIVIALFLLLTDWAIFTKRGYPYRYTLPAMFFLFILTLYPMYYTVSTAFTNYGTGHLFSREQAIDILLTDTSYFFEPEESEFLDFSIYVKYDNELRPTEDFMILFKGEENKYLAPKPSVTEYDSEGNLTYAETNMRLIENNQVRIDDNQYELIVQEENNKVVSIEGNDTRYTYFYDPYDSSVSANSAFYNSIIRQKYLKSLIVKSNIKSFSLSNQYIYKKFGESYKIYETRVKSRISGDRTFYETVVYNTRSNQELVEDGGTFYDLDQDGELKRLIGYKTGVGANNFMKIITDPRISKPFFQIFGWTITYAGLTVLFSFAIGLAFAITLNDSNLKGKILYRTLLIIPWAIPAFISVLVWRNGFFNETYGVLNRFLLEGLFNAEPIKWLQDPFWAKIAVLIVNTWLGFPYMMTVSLGALQSIPDELYEASSIDGASRFKQFRSITLPLLMTSVAPLLVMAFAFNFNNFTNIYLLTQGRPAIPGTNTPAGATDILISYTYKLAFEGSRGQDFGFAAAISVLIFAIIAVLSYVNFKFSGSFEEVNR